MLQPQRLKSRLESVVEMKSQEDEQHNVNDCINLVRKQVDGHIIEIMITGDRHCSLWRCCEAELHEIEIDEVYNQENEDHYPGMDHKLGEK